MSMSKSLTAVRMLRWITVCFFLPEYVSISNGGLRTQTTTFFYFRDSTRDMKYYQPMPGPWNTHRVQMTSSVSSCALSSQELRWYQPLSPLDHFRKERICRPDIVLFLPRPNVVLNPHRRQISLQAKPNIPTTLPAVTFRSLECTIQDFQQRLL